MFKRHRKLFLNKLLILFTLIMIGNVVTAESPSELFSKANNLYKVKQYSEARKIYEQLLEERYGPSLLFNIGNTYYQDNKLGYARAYYEKALLITPRDKDIKHNIKIIKGKMIDAFDEQLPFITILVNSIAQVISINEAALYFWASSLLFLGMLIILIYKQKALIIRISIVIMLFWLISGAVFGYKYYEYNYKPQAVIVVDTIAVKSGPDNDFHTLFSLHEGTKVSIVKNNTDGWLRISIPSGLNGWVPGGSLIKVNPLNIP